MKIYTEKQISKKLNRKKIRKNIVKAIIYPIIIFVLICNIILLIQKIQNPQDIPNVFGYKMFIITSGSMDPYLQIGDVIAIKEIKQEELGKNDIITFNEGEYQVTHRIVDILEENGETVYQTKGDANNTNDSDLVKYENIEGKYVFKIRKVGQIIMKIQNPIYIIVILIVAYVIYSIIDRKDSRRMARYEKRKEYEKKEDFKE